MIHRGFTAGLMALASCVWLSWQARADQTYTTQPGDTLGTIAERFYGEKLEWKRLYQANKQEIGPEPGSLEVGTVLTIPSLDAAGSTAESAEGAQAETDLPEVVLLGRSGFAPFVDPDSPDGGVISHIVSSAFRLAGYDPKLSFSGWEGEAEGLMRVNFPYLESRERAADHLYSVPITIISALPYSHRRAVNFADRASDFGGLRICGTVAVISMAKLTALEAEKAVDWMTPDNLTECFQGLVDDKVDVVLADPSVGARIVEELDIRQELRVGEDAIELGSLHVLAPKFSSYSSAMIYRLDQVLDAMRFSGAIDVMLDQWRGPQDGLGDLRSATSADSQGAATSGREKPKPTM